MGATTEEQTTVELRAENGSSGPIPLDEFSERADAAIDRLRSGQLSFELGTGRRDAPDFATLKIAGQLGVTEDLLYGQPVTVRVIDQRSGEVIAEGSAVVGYPSFKDHFDKHGGKTVERLHTATLE